MKKAVAALVVLAFIVLLAAQMYNNGQLDSVMKLLFGERQQLPYFEPKVNITPPTVPENMSYLELSSFVKVNERRAEAGLPALKWNDELAYVARMYSQDMADRDFFGHISPEGESHDHRLHDEGIYYYNSTAENLALINHASSYTYIQQTGQILNKTYKDLDQVVHDAVQGWMDSPPHRENIERGQFDESGMGVAYSKDNETFLFTQLFTTRIHCGYRGASCCYTEGYLPWCYIPYQCTNDICLQPQ
jgi:uncharacterized protein YkwD